MFSNKPIVATSLVALVALAGAARSGRGSRSQGTEMDAARNIMAQLRRLDSIYRELHWRAKTYSDHLLFQKLYEGVGSSIDQMGELMVVYFGDDAANSQHLPVSDGENKVREASSAIPRVRVQVADAESSERLVLSLSRSLSDELSNDRGFAFQNFLQQLSEERLRALYLLNQVAGSSPNPR